MVRAQGPEILHRNCPRVLAPAGPISDGLASSISDDLVDPTLVNRVDLILVNRAGLTWADRGVPISASLAGPT